MNERQQLNHDLVEIASPYLARLSPGSQLAWITSLHALVAQLFPEDGGG